MATECEELLALAVRRPYGWGWEEDLRQSGRSSSQRRIVCMEPAGTPAGGLVLLMAGRLLDDPTYQQAAVEVARGIAASQQQTGRIPSHATFGPSAGGHDAPAIVPDRASTRASLGLLLTILDTTNPRDERLGRAGKRAASWMLHQQTPTGGWAAGYAPEGSAGDSVRLVRLDSNEYRDSTFALLLAAEVFGDEASRKAAAKSISFLLNLRTNETGGAGEALWATAYTLDGTLSEKLPEFPYGADVLASRFAVQTLMGAYLVSENAPLFDAIGKAARELADLRRPDGQWDRLHDAVSGEAIPCSQPAAAPASATQPATRPVYEPVWPTGPFGLQETLGAAAQLQAGGRERYLAMLNTQFTIKERLAQSLCGLSDQPFTLALPARPDQSPTSLEPAASQEPTLEGGPPADLQGRVHRLWVLVIRTKLEQQASTTQPATAPDPAPPSQAE